MIDKILFTIPNKLIIANQVTYDHSQVFLGPFGT